MKFGAMVTDAGTRRIMDAVHEGKKVNIVGFAVGDGGGAPCTPDAASTELINELWRGAVNSCHISEESENLLVIETVMPSDVGGFTIREMGVFDDDGILVAVSNTPDTQKVRVTDGVVHELNLIMEIALSNTDSVKLAVDPCVLTATKKDIEEIYGEINCMVSYLINPDIAEDAFYSVFTNTEGNHGAAGESMSVADITEATSIPWDGRTSADAGALNQEEIKNALSTPWDGRTSADSGALTSSEISDVTN